MASFEFDSRKIELEICGAKYEVKIDNNTLELCKDIQKKAGEMAKKTSINENAVSDNAVCDFMIESIDKILGKDSATKIFMGRKKNYLDASHLLNFILRELTIEITKDLDFFGASK
jgi:uncharacterized membrane protein YkoI